MDVDSRTITACATAVGGISALIRLSGPRAQHIAKHAGLTIPDGWQHMTQSWSLNQGVLPCSVMFFPAGRSYTGFDLVEIVIPGSADCVELVLHALVMQGAERAEAGGFTRQAFAQGRMDLDQAQAILSLAQAGDAQTAQRALGRLRGALAQELEPIRKELIQVRALVEAGLDFMDEEDVQAFDPDQLQQRCAAMVHTIERWRCAAHSLGDDPYVCLAGGANAGKSALFARLTGTAVLVSDQAGTTRDWLEGTWELPSGRRIRLIDTAGWLQQYVSSLDTAAVGSGKDLLAHAAVILACSAPDAPLTDDWQQVIPNGPDVRVIATKADLGVEDDRASLAVSIESDVGLTALAGMVDRLLGERGGGDPRQQRLLTQCSEVLEALRHDLPPDELLADELRLVCDYLTDLLGETASDDILNHIFSSFCIGK